MARVHIPTPLREFTDGQIKVDVEGGTVRVVVENLESRFPGLKNRLVQQGDLRPGLAIFVDGANSRRGLRTKLREDSEVFFLESIGGGNGPSMKLHQAGRTDLRPGAGAIRARE
ncbi:MAG: MoaD/ThiS family protein [Chloroflexi bacterium]|nr:MoaD/ThiS family protein [Chloroflexota bacterium]